jgi:SAM-dependent methyltransferase
MTEQGAYMGSTVSIEKAMLYDKYRLPYATETVDDLLLRIGEVGIVADIASGTGQLARLFADRSMKVYAVEPDPAMRKVASESLVNFLTVEICAGFAEQIPLAENSIDLIVVGNAFHRFKPEACRELNRILKNQGWIALFSYILLNNEFTDMLSSKMAASKGLAGKMEKTWHKTPDQMLFGCGPIYTLSHRRLHIEDWIAFIGAACAGLEAPERKDADFIQFEMLHREVFDTFAMNGKIQIDYETQVLFGQPSHG